jgi:hypothetical protein
VFKHQIVFPCYKKYQDSRKKFDPQFVPKKERKKERICFNEKAKCQPWVIKIWIKKPTMDENYIKIG